MPKDNLRLGEFEHLILLSVLALEDGAYGASIRNHLHDTIGRDVSLGALYATIERLQARDLVVSFLGGATAKRGGKAKRMVKVTGLGMQALQKTRNHLNTLWDLTNFRETING